MASFDRWLYNREVKGHKTETTGYRLQASGGAGPLRKAHTFQKGLTGLPVREAARASQAS